jgi:hypothetical protein
MDGYICEMEVEGETTGRKMEKHLWMPFQRKHAVKKM